LSEEQLVGKNHISEKWKKKNGRKLSKFILVRRS